MYRPLRLSLSLKIKNKNILQTTVGMIGRLICELGNILNTFHFKTKMKIVQEEGLN